MGRRLKALSAMLFPRSQGWSMAWGGTGFSWEINDGRNSSVVMAPVQWLMRTFPEAPLAVDRLRGAAWEVQHDHPVTKLWSRPNPFTVGELMQQALVASLVFDGNGYLIKRRDDQMRVQELWWTPPDLMTPKWPQDGSTFISHYEYKPGGDAVVLPIEDVIHFRWGVDPENIRLGQSPLSSVFREIFSDEEAARMGAALMKNMGVPGLMIAPAGDQAIGDEDLEATEAAIMDKFTGDRRGQPFVAGSPTTITQFGFSPQQMDLRALRRVPEERVSGVLGIAAIVAGLGAGLDRSTFSNFAEAREASYEGCVIPLQRLMAAELFYQLMPDFEANLDVVRARFDLDEVRILLEDKNAATERKLKELNAGAIMLSEYRRETGRESDNTHDVYIRAFNLTDVRPDQLGVDVLTPVPVVPKMKARVDVQLMETFDRSHERLSRKFAGELLSTFEDVGAAAAVAFEAVAPKMLKAVSVDPSEEDVQRILVGMKMDGFVEVMVKQYGNHYEFVTQTTSSIVNEMYGLNVNLPDGRARQIIAEGGMRVGLVDLPGQTKDAIFRALVDGRTLGEGPDALARRIRSEVSAGRYTNAGAKYRATLIARAETKYAQNVAAMAAYKEAGALRLRAFDAQGSGVSDPECEARDGQVFSHAEAEVELASEHPNGSLSFAPVF